MSYDRIDLKGKAVIITGANTGIGEVTAQALAALGAKVYLACRSKDRTEPVVAAIRSGTGNAEVHFLDLDLSSFESVRTAAKIFLELEQPIDLLINNAGLAGAKGLTADGFELAFGVNHLGHFLFTNLLVDRIVDGGRIVNVSSRAHYKAKSIDWEALRQPTRGLTGLKAYSVSKLANVLFTHSLAKRLSHRNITTYSLHPGVIASDVWRQVPWPLQPLIKRFMLTVEDGAKTTLYCATSVAAGKETGLYYDESAAKVPSRLARDEALAAELWTRSADWVS